MNPKSESKVRRFLIVARAGDSSIHSSWLEPHEFRSFDLCLCYYGDNPGRYARNCKYYLEAKSPEWPGMKEIVKHFSEDLFQYEAIWFPDERLRTNAFTITQMFHIFTDQRLWLGQPALTADSPPFGSVPWQHPDYILRYIPSAELTAPIFSREALRAWAQAPGSGFQLLLPKNLPDPQRRMAVIDATPVKLIIPAALWEPEAEKASAVPPPEQETENHREIREDQELHDSPAAAMTKNGRKVLPIRRSGRSRNSRKKLRLKSKKPKLIHKQKKAVRIPKAVNKRKRKNPAVKKRRHAA